MLILGFCQELLTVKLQNKIWVYLIDILNMHLEQMKQKHYWLDHTIFNWKKLKSFKENKKKFF